MGSPRDLDDYIIGWPVRLEASLHQEQDFDEALSDEHGHGGMATQSDESNLSIKDEQADQSSSMVDSEAHLALRALLSFPEASSEAAGTKEPHFTPQSGNDVAGGFQRMFLAIRSHFHGTLDHASRRVPRGRPRRGTAWKVARGAKFEGRCIVDWLAHRIIIHGDVEPRIRTASRASRASRASCSSCSDSEAESQANVGNDPHTAFRVAGLIAEWMVDSSYLLPSASTLKRRGRDGSQKAMTRPPVSTPNHRFRFSSKLVPGTASVPGGHGREGGEGGSPLLHTDYPRSSSLYRLVAAVQQNSASARKPCSRSNALSVLSARGSAERNHKTDQQRTQVGDTTGGGHGVVPLIKQPATTRVHPHRRRRVGHWRIRPSELPMVYIFLRVLCLAFLVYLSLMHIHYTASEIAQAWLAAPTAMTPTPIDLTPLPSLVESKVERVQVLLRKRLLL